ncbi:MAG: septation protein SepH [Actinomycetes bacterium]
MAVLRLLAVSEDGTQLLLAGDGETHRLPIDDRLRAAVRGERSRLGRTENEMESQLRPRDIQARIRAGESAESVAEAAGLPIERIRRFEGPVLAERGHVASLAQGTSLRRSGEGPSPALGDIVGTRVAAQGAKRDSADWDAWRREDGRWTVCVTWRVGDEQSAAHWVYDPVRRAVVADDDAARDLVDPLPATTRAPSPEAHLEREEARSFVPRLAAVPDAPGPAVEQGATAHADPDPLPLDEDTEPTTGSEPVPDGEPASARKAVGERRSNRRASVPSWDEIVFGSRRGE